MEVINQIDPGKVGTVAALLAFIYLLVRTVQTRKWVPGIYFEDMRADRDTARAEAKRSIELLGALQLAHAEVLYQNSMLLRLAGQDEPERPHRLPRRQELAEG